MKILHFGDVHLPLPPGALHSPAVLHPRRIPAVVNYFLRRGRHYARGASKLEALAAFLRRNPVDWVFYAGDSVNMGLAAEFRVASPRLDAVFRLARRGAVAVPGNHDFYTSGSVVSFRRWMKAGCESGPSGIREGAPRMKVLSPDAAVVAFETACPHWAFWNSSGRLAAKDRGWLEDWLDGASIRAKSRVFLLTHYPPDDTNPFHGMRGTGKIADLLSGRRNVVVLHGHVHALSVRRISVGGADIPVYCSGSLSKEGMEAFWLHELSGGRLISRRGRWTGAEWVLDAPIVN